MATYLAAEEERLYAITPKSILVLAPESLKTLPTVDFGRFLDRKTLERAEPSGLAVAHDIPYMTLEGGPFLMQISENQSKAGRLGTQRLRVSDHGEISPLHKGRKHDRDPTLALHHDPAWPPAVKDLPFLNAVFPNP